jgi:hypothetical protein
MKLQNLRAREHKHETRVAFNDGKEFSARMPRAAAS